MTAHMDQSSPEQLATLAQESQGATPKIIVIVFTTLSFVCVCLRFFTRLTCQRNVGWEDYTIALSMCFSIAMAVCQVYQVEMGSGKHQMFLELSAVSDTLKFLYFSILAYNLSLTLTKMSILIQYHRIFNTMRQMRISIYVIMGICVAFGLESVISGIFMCIPVDAFWNLTKQPTASCVNQNALYYFNASMNIVTDLLVALLPVRSILGLQIPKRQKIVLLTILTLGWFVCVVSMLRLHALVVLAKHPEDTTWNSTATAYWSAIEVNLAIVCASTPALKPLVVRLIPAFSTMGSNLGTVTRIGATHSKSGRFVELNKTGPSSATAEHMELGATTRITAQCAASNKSGGKVIHVQYDIERSTVQKDRDSDSDSGSERDLVPTTSNVELNH